MPMTPPTDPKPKPAAPFEIVLTKNADETWVGVIELPPPLPAEYRTIRGGSRVTGEAAELAVRAKALLRLAVAAGDGLALPPEVEALFCRRIA